MTTTHTPGPWRTVASYQPESGKVEVNASAPYVVDATGRNVAAAMIGGFDDDAEVLANARLIAQAPDLMDRLTMALFVLNGLSDMYPETRQSAVVRRTIDIISATLRAVEG